VLRDLIEQTDEAAYDVSRFQNGVAPEVFPALGLTTDLVYQVVGLSGWYSQTSKKCVRSTPLRCSARSMNWAVVTLP
jgi:hypothetical protein